ncbi:MAG TPA: homoserine dehydrogenase, partial [Actinomycetota bacterium]|nr:homoserine dehydrogenase [Actinomycetota bacterium]
MTDAVGVGFLGCGTVGSAVLRLLDEHAEDIAARSGCRFEVRRVAVHEPSRRRDDVPVPADRFTSDPEEVVKDPEVAVIVEVMGGIDPARELVLSALSSGKRVVTANKELLATHGPELFEAAATGGAGLHFEATVAGGVPLIRPLIESLTGERITRLLGIVNGTTNYVLTRMTDEGVAYEEALAEAQRLGYAEADPTDDVEGFDAAAKCAILASLAFDTRVVVGDVYREGITRVSAEDIEFARRLGYVVKLLAVAELEDGDVAVRVHPAMIPVDHPLAAVRDAFNAVFLDGPRIGELMFYGRGAGGDPTATAVVGDIVHIMREMEATHVAAPPAVERRRAIRPMERMEGQYYLCLAVADRPGVLASVAGAFADNLVSIKSVWQEGTGEEALLVLITHRANEGSMQRTVTQLRGLDTVKEVRSVMRV